MIEILVSEKELYLESIGEFVKIPETKLQLEHSLLSVKKWESKWHKSFLQKNEKSMDEILDYIRCMIINKNVHPFAHYLISKEDVERIIKYINDPMTATTFSDPSKIGAAKHSGEYITSETIYYWMISLNIPVEFQKWHLNQLLALIKMTSIKNAPPKKMSAKEAARRRASLNAARKAKLGTRG